MSLDVYIQPRAEIPRDGSDYEYVCALDDDGYYWFLEPLFARLTAETGQHVDLYGGAVFAGATLDALMSVLTAARELTERQPERWEVVTGVRPGVEPEEVRCSVQKAEMRALLEKLAAAARKARATGQYLAFFGD